MLTPNGVTIQQSENENLSDKDVENIVVKVLGIGFSSLNSQEDEIWNDIEMKTILDNIDIGSPMTRSKTNTPIIQVIQSMLLSTYYLFTNSLINYI
uniref:Uncharacterized protein n=1 Tax=Lactuca sativa TaxID=4236 RepID=A0A9R1UMM4_LACSA|nr:hypothetical protein LSAT_V11C800448680 [Lactuca sativa]